MKPETAGNTPEPIIEEWMRRAEDAIVADVRQQNKGLGRPIVWVTDRDRWAKLIAEAGVAASSHPETEDGNTPEPLTPIERAARRLAANHTICSQIYSEKWRVEHIEQVLESEFGVVAASSKEAGPDEKLQNLAKELVAANNDRGRNYDSSPDEIETLEIIKRHLRGEVVK